MRRALVFLSLLATVGCGGADVDPTDPPLNVVLISIDTLRADHLGCYGYERATTPNIDRFAARSILFERCQSAVPITLPSHTTMLTGMYPIRHSVRDNGTFAVPEGLPTLATILRAEGYTTMAAIGAFPLTSRFGLDRGFDVYDDELQSGEDGVLALFFDERKADRVTARAVELLDAGADGPFFLFVHYFDPHHPWNPPSQYLRQHPELPYDAEISFVDTWIGRLLDEIDSRGLRDDTIVILTADHGEGLDHNREYTHSFLLYNGTLHVPLMVSIPGREPGRIHRFVSLTDIMPTVLDLLDIDIEHDIDGRSLIGPADDDRLIYMESLAGRLERGWNDMRAVLSHRHKLILGNPSELYDLDADPAELEDLSSDDPTRAARLEKRLRDYIAQAPTIRSLAEGYSIADAEVESRLRALGYLTGDASGRALDELGEVSSDGDPRPLVRLVWVQSAARALINEGAYHDAITLLEDTLERVGDDPDYSHHLALAYTLAGDFDNALPLIETMLRNRTGNDISPFVLMSVTQANLGHLDAALDAIDEALAIVPDLELKTRKAGLLERSGRRDDAVAVLNETLDEDECQMAALTELAKLHRTAGDRDRAEGLYRTMLDCQPHNLRAMYNLGTMELESGDLKAAERWFTDAIEADPSYPGGHYGLALVELQTGDREGAIASLRRSLAASPAETTISQHAAKLLSTLQSND